MFRENPAMHMLEPSKEVVDFVVLQTIEVGSVDMDILMLQSHHHSQGLQVTTLQAFCCHARKYDLITPPGKADLGVHVKRE